MDEIDRLTIKLIALFIVCVTAVSITAIVTYHAYSRPHAVTCR